MTMDIRIKYDRGTWETWVDGERATPEEALHRAAHQLGGLEISPNGASIAVHTLARLKMDTDASQRELTSLGVPEMPLYGNLLQYRIRRLAQRERRAERRGWELAVERLRLLLDNTDDLDEALVRALLPTSALREWCVENATAAHRAIAETVLGPAPEVMAELPKPVAQHAEPAPPADPAPQPRRLRRTNSVCVNTDDGDAWYVYLNGRRASVADLDAVLPRGQQRAAIYRVHDRDMVVIVDAWVGDAEPISTEEAP